MRYFAIVLFFCISSNAYGQGQIKKLEEAKAQEAAQKAQVQLDQARSQLSYNSTGWNSYGYGGYQQQLVYFLMSPMHQKEMELSSEQKKMLTDLNKKMSTGYREIYAKYPELKDPKLDYKKRAEINKKLQNEYTLLRKEIDEEIRDSLVPNQLVVLKKLQFNQSLRIYGFSNTVSRKPFKEDIETTDDQVKEIQKIRQETEAEIQKLIEEKRKAGKEKMLKVLNAKQRKKIKELEGDGNKSKFTRL